MTVDQLTKLTPGQVTSKQLTNEAWRQSGTRLSTAKTVLGCQALLGRLGEFTGHRVPDVEIFFFFKYTDGAFEGNTLFLNS